MASPRPQSYASEGHAAALNTALPADRSSSGDPFASRSATPASARAPFDAPFAAGSRPPSQLLPLDGAPFVPPRAASRPASQMFPDDIDGEGPLAPPAVPYGTRDVPSPYPSFTGGADSPRESAYDPYRDPASAAGTGARNSALAQELPLLGHGPRDSGVFAPGLATPGKGSYAGSAAALAGADAAERVGMLGDGVPPPGFREYSEKGLGGAPARPLVRRKRFWAAVLAALAVVVVAVVVPVYFLVVKKHSGAASSSSGSSGGGGGGGGTPSSDNPGSATGAITGGDGSVIIADDGSQFTYNNSFGGFWYFDPSDPFNNNARPNSWTKPLNESWDFVNDRMYGVNLGGWFVLEPFITPAFYQAYPGAVDEWTLSALMANDTANGGLQQIENHYATFITEKDIAEIAGAGLNWVRLPIPYWAIDTWNDEPFLAQKSWPYIVKLLGWARKYGLRVNLDLHTIPGSQNGYNHSGRLGSINWLYGIMGLANAQRSLDYIRTIAEFISQPEYQAVVPIFGIVNEALLGDIGIEPLTRFYLDAHNMIRNITGIGQGAFISIHDGFQGNAPWDNFLQGSDRILMDTHPYFAFGGAATDPFLNGTGLGAGGVWPTKACLSWGFGIVQSQDQFGITIAGEFSNGWNDCGTFLHGVGDTTPSYPGDCTPWTDASLFTDEMKDGLNNFISTSMDTLQNWFFWTWKIAPAQSGHVEAPLWSYQLGYEGGWIPKDPRSAAGYCNSYGVTIAPMTGTFSSWQTGGAGAGTIAPASLTQFGQWPPPTLSGLPATFAFGDAATYTPTATMTTLAMPTITDGKGHTAKLSASGWADPADTQGRMTAVAGCVYPDPWTIGPTPTAVCGAGATASYGTLAGVGSPMGSLVPPPPTSTAARK